MIGKLEILMQRGKRGPDQASPIKTYNEINLYSDRHHDLGHCMKAKTNNEEVQIFSATATVCHDFIEIYGIDEDFYGTHWRFYPKGQS